MHTVRYVGAQPTYTSMFPTDIDGFIRQVQPCSRDTHSIGENNSLSSVILPISMYTDMMLMVA